MERYDVGRTPWVMYLWPGLPLVWKRGSWLGLAWALGFAAVVNLALAGSVLWCELFPSTARILLWTVVGVVGCLSALYAYRWERLTSNSQSLPPAEDAFPRALDHYLKGNWFEAEQVLTMLLKQRPRDVDAALLLATLWRHTGRHEEAWRQLDRLECLEESKKWELEISRERALLIEARESRAQSEAPAVEPPVTPPAALVDAA
jgi:tetratricopeptide (TPR) repeat protein